MAVTPTPGDPVQSSGLRGTQETHTHTKGKKIKTKQKELTGNLNTNHRVSSLACPTEHLPIPCVYYTHVPLVSILMHMPVHRTLLGTPQSLPPQM